MLKDIVNFSLKLLGFSLLLCAIHYYIYSNFYSDAALYLPIWGIYVFNFVLVLAVYALMNHKAATDESKVYNTFLILTIAKMALAIVFLLPLFVGKSENSTIEVINFFVAYFLFLGFEIKMLDKFLKDAQTK
tara:strand:- start:2690 stop:3085 length:396 start_codon:yes stop_codon:yes gene_type:complete